MQWLHKLGIILCRHDYHFYRFLDKNAKPPTAICIRCGLVSEFG